MSLPFHHGLRPLRISAFPLSRSITPSAILLVQTDLLRQTVNHNPLVRRNSTAVRTTHNKLVNPPSSTLPFPLVLPVRAPDQSTPAYYFSLGKAYLRFYKAGLGGVWTNYKLSKAIRARLPPSTSPDDAVASALLSRSEWQLLRRSKQDMWKIPPFILVFMICGEFTPLVVALMSGAVPRTCYVPSQVISNREKAEERRKRSFREGIGPEDGKSKVMGKDTGVKVLSAAQVLHVGRSVGLFSRVLDRVNVTPPTGLVRARAKKWIRYLELDAMAIERCGGVEQMEMEEVKIALEERGVDVLGRNDALLRGLLKSWLKAEKKHGVVKLLLTRPSVWDESPK